MGFITEILKDVPLSAVLKERLAIADKEAEMLKSENANLSQLVRQKDQEIQGLKQTIQELWKSHDLPPLKFIAPFCYADGDLVPFCPVCWETEHIRIHLPSSFSTGSGPCYRCLKCKREIIHPRIETKSSGGFRA